MVKRTRVRPYGAPIRITNGKYTRWLGRRVINR
jgi:hypothetical protein